MLYLALLYQQIDLWLEMYMTIASEQQTSEQPISHFEIAEGTGTECKILM
jgi:hypothetical protein